MDGTETARRVYANEAREAFYRCLRSGKGTILDRLMGKGDDDTLLSFTKVQKENNAFSKVDRGIKNVPIEKIVGSVDKYADFDSRLMPKEDFIRERWCKIYIAHVSGEPLPPAELYKIRDDYFIYDGNHRVSVGKYLGQKFVEAHVAEFIPSEDTFENALYLEKFSFERKTALEGKIEFTELGEYDKITKEIAEYGESIEGSLAPSDLKGIAKKWYEHIYQPTVRILEANKMIESFPGRTYSDLYNYITKHKYYESEKKGYDVGYNYAIIDFINVFNQTSEEAKAEATDLSEEVEPEIVLTEDVIESFNILSEESLRAIEGPFLEKERVLSEVAKVEFRFPIIILSEVEEYANGSSSFEEAVRRWHKDSYRASFERFKEELGKYDRFYKKAYDLIKREREKLYIELLLYRNRKQKGEPALSKVPEAVASYVGEVFVPAVSMLRSYRAKLKDYSKLYFELLEHKNYLEEYISGIKMEEAAESFFKDEKGKNWLSRILRNSTLLRWDIFSRKNRRSYLISDQIRNISDLFGGERDITAYGMPTEFSTLYNIRKAINDYLGDHLNDQPIDWYDKNFVPEMASLAEDEEILKYIKDQNAYHKIEGRNIESSLLDFYAKVKGFVFYEKGSFETKDIVAEARRYIRNHPLVIS